MKKYMLYCLIFTMLSVNAIAGTFTIASWNIENFGKKKATNPEIMKQIVSTVIQYDLIAVQEVSNVHEFPDPNCDRNANAKDHKNYMLITNAFKKHLPSNYGFVISPHVKDERYMFLFNKDKVNVITTFMVNDFESGQICESNNDIIGKMIRQPFCGYFKVGGFDFILATVHTSPSKNKTEFKGLFDYYSALQSSNFDDDIIIVGDLNIDCSYYVDNNFNNSYFNWIVGGDEDTSVSKTDCAYDRFIITPNTLGDYTGKYGIQTTITDDISDHYVIWAQFNDNKDVKGDIVW